MLRRLSFDMVSGYLLCWRAPPLARSAAVMAHAKDHRLLGDERARARAGAPEAGRCSREMSNMAANRGANYCCMGETAGGLSRYPRDYTAIRAIVSGSTK
jgi:hypothetical protein